MTNPRDVFEIRRGNLLPIIQRVLQYADGTPCTLTGCTIAFNYAPRDGDEPVTSAAVSRTAAIVSATLGIASYTWVAGDTAVVGEYFAEFVVTTAAPASKPISFPNAEDEYILLRVTQDVMGA